MNMKQVFSLFLLVSTLAACTPAPCVQYIECPDGDCKQQAQETCPAGYKQLNESDVGPDFAAFAAQHFGGPSVPHMIVTCNP